jgi:hypothetical protein
MGGGENYWVIFYNHVQNYSSFATRKYKHNFGIRKLQKEFCDEPYFKESLKEILAEKKPIGYEKKEFTVYRFICGVRWLSFGNE